MLWDEVGCVVGAVVWAARGEVVGVYHSTKCESCVRARASIVANVCCRAVTVLLCCLRALGGMVVSSAGLPVLLRCGSVSVAVPHPRGSGVQHQASDAVHDRHGHLQRGNGRGAICWCAAGAAGRAHHTLRRGGEVCWVWEGRGGAKPSLEIGLLERPECPHAQWLAPQCCHGCTGYVHHAQGVIQTVPVPERHCPLFTHPVCVVR